jgi:hypothetical protein
MEFYKPSKFIEYDKSINNESHSKMLLEIAMGLWDIDKDFAHYSLKGKFRELAKIGIDITDDLTPQKQFSLMLIFPDNREMVGHAIIHLG